MPSISGYFNLIDNTSSIPTEICKSFYKERYYMLFEIKIKTDLSLFINDENLHGNSILKNKVLLHKIIFEYFYTLYMEVKKYNKSWEYIVEKYNLVNIQKCLACIKVNINDVLSIFDLPTVEGKENVRDFETETLQISNNTTLSTLLR